jgi:cytochrome c biogenesis protein CcdA
MHQILGPVLLLLGMFLVGLININSGGMGVSESMQKRVDAMGIWGALFLGVLFAVSFCPTSAAWFFGLVALTLGTEAGAIEGVLEKVGIAMPEASIPGGAIVLPIIYGVGTALPVLLVSFLLAYSANEVGKTYNVLSKVEWWARMITGWLFIAVGAGFSLKFVFEAL